VPYPIRSENPKNPLVGAVGPRITGATHEDNDPAIDEGSLAADGLWRVVGGYRHVVRFDHAARIVYVRFVGNQADHDSIVVKEV